MKNTRELGNLIELEEFSSGSRALLLRKPLCSSKASYDPSGL